MAVRKRVYVAGPWQNEHHHEVARNEERGIKQAAELHFDGFAPFCPFLQRAYLRYEPNGDNGDRESEFLDTDLSHLAAADALLVLPNHENSNGTKKEIEFATDHDITVFYSYGALLDYAILNWGYEQSKLTFGG